jgi:hypothetical protein
VESGLAKGKTRKTATIPPYDTSYVCRGKDSPKKKKKEKERKINQPGMKKRKRKRERNGEIERGERKKTNKEERKARVVIQNHQHHVTTPRKSD